MGLIGGSASTNIYLPATAKTWPQLLAELHDKECELYVRQQGMLTISRALPLASSFPEVDVLLLSFATTLGWPVISKRITRLLVPEFQSETALHLAAFPSRSRVKRIKKLFRRFALNTLKYCAFPLGLYRPTNNLSDLEDQVRALVAIASAKAKKVVWIQHQPMRDNRIWLERRVFDKYYRELINTLSKVDQANFRFIAFPAEFLEQENYCLDEVHLSELGHRNLAQFLHHAGVLKA